MFDLLRVLVAGVVLGLIVGRLVVRDPFQLERLRPRYWRRAIRKMKRREWIKLFAVALSVAAASLLFSTVIGLILQQSDIQVVNPQEYPFTAIEQSYPLLVLVTVNILPIFEEWIFRGVIIDAMVRWRKSKLLAVVVSAVLFSAFHLSNPGTYPAIVVSMLPASLLLGVCYLYTGLGGAIVAHNAYNTYLVIIGVLMR